MAAVLSDDEHEEVFADADQTVLDELLGRLDETYGTYDPKLVAGFEELYRKYPESVSVAFNLWVALEPDENTTLRREQMRHAASDDFEFSGFAGHRRNLRNATALFAHLFRPYVLGQAL